MARPRPGCSDVGPGSLTGATRLAAVGRRQLQGHVKPVLLRAPAPGGQRQRQPRGTRRPAPCRRDRPAGLLRRRRRHEDHDAGLAHLHLWLHATGAPSGPRGGGPQGPEATEPHCHTRASGTDPATAQVTQPPRGTCSHHRYPSLRTTSPRGRDEGADAPQARDDPSPARVPHSDAKARLPPPAPHPACRARGSLSDRTRPCHEHGDGDGDGRPALLGSDAAMNKAGQMGQKTQETMTTQARLDLALPTPATPSKATVLGRQEHEGSTLPGPALRARTASGTPRWRRRWPHGPRPSVSELGQAAPPQAEHSVRTGDGPRGSCRWPPGDNRCPAKPWPCGATAGSVPTPRGLHPVVPQGDPRMATGRSEKSLTRLAPTPPCLCPGRDPTVPPAPQEVGSQQWMLASPPPSHIAMVSRAP